MLFLLRNIRRRLLTDNKVTTYLLYAIGEILLVVIGILIAVQIDNWKEDRQTRAAEMVYLENLANDLKTDTSSLSSIISLATNKSLALQRMNDRAKHKSIENIYQFSSDLLSILWDETFIPNTNTYDEMVSSGNLSIINNEELKLNLLNLNQQYNSISYNQTHMRKVYDNMLIQPFSENLAWRDYFDMKKFRSSQELTWDSLYLDQNQQEHVSEALSLLENKQFQNGLLFFEFDNKLMLNLYEEGKQNAATMIEKIDKEINN